MSDLFVSYEHESGDFIRVLRMELEQQGYGVWWDGDIAAGQEWRKEIDEAIRNALAVIVVMTPAARASEYVTYEWSLAIGLGKAVIPILLKHTPLHPRLEVHHYLDFTSIQVRPWNDLFIRLKDISATALAGEPGLQVREPETGNGFRQSDLLNLLTELYFADIIDLRTLNSFLQWHLLDPRDIKHIRQQKESRSLYPRDHADGRNQKTF